MKPVALDTLNGSGGLSDLLNRQTIPLETPRTEDFGNMLKDLVEEVNQLQHEAAEKEKQFLRGEISDIHQVMIATEEAAVALTF